MTMTPEEEPSTEHFDVLVVGAGISGVSAAHELLEQCSDRSFVVLDSFESFGGTWRCHTYPGVRSDSDLFTFGYRFKPWLGAPIASRDEILKYLGEVIDENGIDQYIRYGHHVVSANWSSAESCWTLDVMEGQKKRRFTCTFLWMCQGYFRHAKGYTPNWPDMDKFEGAIVHPQNWPSDLDYRGKKAIVIGSGAAAATVVPAIAKDCEHVTMLQRSPTYFFGRKNRHGLAETLRKINVDEKWIHEIVRRKIVSDENEFLARAMEKPETVKAELLEQLKPYMSDEEIEKNFTPTYRPWQQRIAVVPENDLFESIQSGRASVVTDTIEKFTESGILTKSGKEIDADIVITATGFNLSILGDINFAIDGQPLNFSETVTYRGMMFTDVPNMAWVFGYLRAASWTLRSELVSDFVCRLLNHMRDRGAARVDVQIPPEYADMKLLPWVDDEVFNPGYLMRGMHMLPRRGDKREWAHSNNYYWERDALPLVDLDEPALNYSDMNGDRLEAEAGGEVEHSTGR